MRRLTRLILAAAAATVVLILPAPVSAQSFFEALFGSSGPKPAAPILRPAPQRLLPPPVYSPYRPERSEAKPRQGGMVRTLCVRLCDGYYFPINFSTPRHKASQDADQCAASCNGEARLFYTSSPNGEIESAHDLTGRSYKSLPNAFLYRKRYVASCTCRPPPWSQAERNRHRRYAIAEGRLPEHASGDVRVVAGAGASGNSLTPPEVIAGKPAVGPAAEPPVDNTPTVVAEAPAAEPTADTAPIPASPQARRRQATKPAGKKPVVAKTAAPLNRPTKVANQTGSTWSLGGQPKYSWPGDAPARYR